MTDDVDLLCPLADACWLVARLLHHVDQWGAGWAICRRATPHVAYRIQINFDGRHEPWLGRWKPTPREAYEDALTYMEDLR